MLLMSEGLADRLVLSQIDDEAVADEQDDNVIVQEQKAVVQFVLGTEVIRCAVKRMLFATDIFSATFTTVPSLPLRLRDNAPIRCTLSCGSYMLDFDLKAFDIEWDNTEGKQLCTIISKIEQQSRSTG